VCLCTLSHSIKTPTIYFAATKRGFGTFLKLGPRKIVVTKSDSSKAAPIALLLLPYGEHTIGATYKSLEIKRTIDLASRYDGDREVRCAHGKKKPLVMRI
jgi:hypothetical protein